MENGQTLVYDATCSDTLAPSNLKFSSKGIIAQHYLFLPFAVQTIGPWYKEGKNFIKQIGRTITSITGESRSTAHTIQRISIDIQRHSSTWALLESLSNPFSSSLDEMFFVF